MSAAGIILLILFLIGFSVSIYYAFICFKVKSKNINVDPEHGPLIFVDPDVNGNHEEPSAPETETINCPSHSLDQPDSTSDENEKIRHLFSSESPLAINDKNITTAIELKSGVKPVKTDTLLTIEEEPNSPSPSPDTKRSEHSNSEPTPNITVDLVDTIKNVSINLPTKSHPVKYIGDTDEEDGLLQNRPQLDDSLDSQCDEASRSTANPESPSPSALESIQIQDHIPSSNISTSQLPYGWQHMSSEDSKDPIISSQDNKEAFDGAKQNINKTEDKLSKCAAPTDTKKYIIPSKLTVLPSIACTDNSHIVHSSDFPSSDDEPVINMDETSVAEPFYQPVLTQAAVSLAYHLSSQQDTITSESSIKMSQNETLVYQTVTQSIKTSTQESNSDDEVPELVDARNSFPVKILFQQDEVVPIAIQEKQAAILNLKSSDGSLDNIDGNYESESSEPEITEYSFHTSQAISTTLSIIADEVGSTTNEENLGSVQVTGFIPLYDPDSMVISSSSGNSVQQIETKLETKAEVPESVVDSTVKNLCPPIIITTASNSDLTTIETIPSDHGNRPVDSTYNISTMEGRKNVMNRKILLESTVPNESSDSESSTSSSSSDVDELERSVSEELIAACNETISIDSSRTFNETPKNKSLVISNPEIDSSVPVSPSHESSPSFLVLKTASGGGDKYHNKDLEAMPHGSDNDEENPSVVIENSPHKSKIPHFVKRH